MNAAHFKRLQITDCRLPIRKLNKSITEIRNLKSEIGAQSGGFTLIEILITITILATLGGGVILTLNPVKQLNKSRDAQRQSDLTQIRLASDAYYNDTHCYPTEMPFGQEWSVGNTVYMKQVPQDSSCNGGTGTCYRYRTESETTCPQWNVVFAKLSDTSNTTNACPLSSLSNCAPAGYSEGNWACALAGSVNCSSLASAATLIGGEETTASTVTPTVAPTATAAPSGTPTPTSTFPPGSVTYAIGNPAGTNPDIYELTMMPLWQTIGNAQQIQVKIDDTAGDISSNVQLILYSDNEAREFTLTRTSGTTVSGIWTGTWQVTDTYNTQYGVDITANDSVGNTSTKRLTFR